MRSTKYLSLPEHPGFSKGYRGGAFLTERQEGVGFFSQENGVSAKLFLCRSKGGGVEGF